MTYNFEYETDIRLDLPYEEIIKSVIDEAMDYEQCPYEAEINILLTSNEEIRKINNEYRQIDNATDVLSFPLVEYASPADFAPLEDDDYSFNPDTGELMLGDIILSVEKVMEQAEKYGHSQKRELAFLTAHSMLHLFGYDHMEEDEAKVMEERQNSILMNLGINR